MPLPPLELEQILGLSTETHNSVHFVSPNHIVYPVEALVVVLDTASRRQAFFRGHSHVVSTLAVHAGKRLCASGQRFCRTDKIAGNGQVLVWQWTNRAVVRTLTHHKGDVLAVSFSVCGTRVFSVGTESSKASVAVWSLGPNPAKKVCTATLHGEVVHAAVPGPADLPEAFEWVTYGVGQVKFWSLSKYSPTLTARKGTFGAGCPSGVVPTVTAVTFLAGELVAGTSDGRLYYFEGTRGNKCTKAAKCAIAHLTTWRNRLVAALSSGRVLLVADHHTKEVALTSMAGAPDARLQSPVLGGASSKTALVLYSAAHVFHADLGALDKVRVLSETSPKALTCVAAQPDCFLVGSFDGFLRVYGADGKAALKTHRAGGPVTTCAISGPYDDHPTRKFRLLAAGSAAGVLEVLNEWDMSIVYERQIAQSKGALLSSAFSALSPSHDLWLATGGQDALVYCTVFPRALTEDLAHGLHQERRAEGQVAVKGPVLRGHSAPVVAVQFSSTTPPEVLASVALDGQILCFDLAGQRRLPSVRFLLELPFEPYQLPLGPVLDGLWSQDGSAADATSSRGQAEQVRNTASSMLGATPTALPERYVVQAPGRNLVAVSTPHTHEIRLAELPVTQEGRRFPAHSARITGLAWSSPTSLLSVTTSRCIAKWRVGSGPAEKERAPAATFAPPQRVAVTEKENDSSNAVVSKDALEKLGVSPSAKSKPDVPSSVASERCGDDLGATYSSKAEDWADAWGVAPQVAVVEEEEEPLPPVPATEPPLRPKRGSGAFVSPGDTWTSSLHDWTQPRPEPDIVDEASSLGGYAGPPPRNLQALRTRNRDFVSPKIGSRVAAAGMADNMDAWKQTQAFCRDITDKGKRSPGVAECLTSVADDVRPRSVAADPELRSKFEHTATAGGNFDIEVKLPGTLTLVRADLGAQQVIVDGLCDGAPERLVVRVPSGYDLGARLRTVKKYDQGYARLLIPRQSIHKTSREGVIKL